jgi:Phospholipase_D-nuclease N-terminal
MIEYLPFLLVLALWIHAFVDCLNTPEDEVRNLPKAVWLLVVVVFGAVLAGPLAWFAAGRPRRGEAVRPDDAGTEPPRWIAPDDNPEFLRSLDAANRLRREDEDGTSHG